MQPVDRQTDRRVGSEERHYKSIPLIIGVLFDGTPV